MCLAIAVLDTCNLSALAAALPLAQPKKISACTTPPLLASTSIRKRPLPPGPESKRTPKLYYVAPGAIAEAFNTGAINVMPLSLQRPEPRGPPPWGFLFSCPAKLLAGAFAISDVRQLNGSSMPSPTNQQPA